MKPVATAQQVRELDAAVIEGLGMPGRTLMEIAGRGAAAEIHARWPQADALVLCGPGNNGGDGYVVARWLHLWGHTVHLQPVLPPRTPDATSNAALCAALGIPSGPVNAPTLVVDAMLGTGQGSAPRGAILDGVRLITGARQDGATIIALDLPTGVDADTGQPFGAEHVHADLTVTFGRAKRGLYCEPGASLAGEIRVVDIGLDMARDATLRAPGALLVQADDVRAWLPPVGDHQAKWDRGHVAVWGGGGAAVLAAHGAFRAGAGLVTLLTPRSEWGRLHGLWPEVILAEPDALDPARHDVLVIGPGLGLDQQAGVLDAWSHFPGATLADADALTLIAKHGVTPTPDSVRVLTPHAAEAARLLGTGRGEVEADRFGAVEALRVFGTPLLKGPHTLVGADTTWILPFRDGRLATAGSGDLLSGMVGAMLGRGLLPERALASAAWLHAEAASRAPALATASALLDAVRALPD